LSIAFCQQINPLAPIACKHRALGNCFDRRLVLILQNKEEITWQHQIEDLPPSVRTDRASPDRAGDDVVPVTRGPWIVGNFLAAIAEHDLGKCIETFQRMRLRRKYSPIVVRCVGSRFHGRILFDPSAG
jgi:hypothetical protein